MTSPNHDPFVVELVRDQETIIFGEIDPRGLLRRPMIETIDDKYLIEQEIEES